MDKELKEELTTTLNMVLFSAAILSLMLAGFILAMNDYQVLSCLITLPSYLVGMYVLTVRPEVLK